MKKVFLIIFALLAVFTLPTLPIIRASNQPQPKMMDIYSITGNIYIHDNGLTDINITISPIYNDILNWDLGVKSLTDFNVEANGIKIKPKDYSLKKVQGFYRIMSDRGITASNWRISFKSHDMFFITDRDYFKWYAVSTNHRTIGQVFFTLKTDTPLAGNDRKSYRLYAFHGVDYSQALMVNNRKVIFEGSNLASSAGFSLYAGWPKGTIQFPFFKRLSYGTSDLPIVNWVIFGLILPIVSIVLLAVLFLRHKAQEYFNSTAEKIENPPSKLSPLQVGILVDKKIYAKTLMATIIDLCERDYLVIVRKNNEFYFAKRRLPDQNLSYWEAELVEELTVANKILATDMQIKAQINRNIFSPEIKASYEQAYLSVTEMGYFDQNPHYVRVKYKIYAIILYLVSIIGLVWVAATMQTPFLLIPIIGVLLSSMFVIKFAYLLPTQSKKGLEARKQWLKYRNYLKDKEPVPSMLTISGTFYQYLPFAIVLGVQKEWSKRFSATYLPMPKWLIEHDLPDEETRDTIRQIISIINDITLKISQLKGPSVK